jgi:hypothetical protein
MDPDRIAALCDIALQDSQVEREIDGEKVWVYDGQLFLKSLADNGLTIHLIGETDDR